MVTLPSTGSTSCVRAVNASLQIIFLPGFLFRNVAAASKTSYVKGRKRDYGVDDISVRFHRLLLITSIELRNEANGYELTFFVGFSNV